MSGADKDRENPGSKRSISTFAVSLPQHFPNSCAHLSRQAEAALCHRKSRRNGSKSRILLGNPVQRIKRNHKIKLVLEWQATSVRHLKSKVRPRCRTEVALSEANHVT